MRVQRVHFRGILESRGKLTVEVEVTLGGDWVGIASAPVAIAPGRLERRRSYIRSLGPLDSEPGLTRLRAEIEGRCFASQAHLDSFLNEVPIALELGADVRLVLSVAFCRACAAAQGESFLSRLTRLWGAEPAVPRPLVNLFSGGIHDQRQTLPFQQIMFAPNCGRFRANLELALAVYSACEQHVRESVGELRYSASSGLLVDGAGPEQLLEAVTNAIRRLGYPPRAARLGIDVAAEHMRTPDGSYRLGQSILGGAELLERLKDLVLAYNVGFLEDPFDAADTPLWRVLTAQLRPTTLVVGDDLFASDGARIERGLATGIILKPNQVGTVSGVLTAAREARGAGMALCVSHRSGETEDALVCDLAVAVGASFAKLGGPRRGDRTVKYNHLLRLAEQIEPEPGPLTQREVRSEEDYQDEADAAQ